MGYPVISAANADQEVAEATVEHYPTVRLFRVQASTNEGPCNTEHADCPAAVRTHRPFLPAAKPTPSQHRRLTCKPARPRSFPTT